MATILQASILTEFMYPMLLIFFISFAILQKTKMFGEGKAQLNAMIALIVSLIFVGAVFPKIITAHLLEYLAVALIVIFVGLMLWGFVSGNKDLTLADGEGRKIHKFFVFLLLASLVAAILWATGFGSSVWNGLMKFLSLIFGPNTGGFWTNALFIAIIFIAVLVALGKFPPKFKSNPWIKLK